MPHTPTREEAYELLTTYTKSQSLIRHALAVEAVMRHFAQEWGEDQERWGVIGLVHDLDWEQFPREHCQKTKEILSQADWPPEYIRSIMSHGWGLVTDVRPEHRMEKALYAVDELTGLITATALMRPSKSVMDMQAKSVKKKWKDKSFAAGANREVIAAGAQMLEMGLSDLITETIMAMRTVADQLGLGMQTE